MTTLMQPPLLLVTTGDACIQWTAPRWAKAMPICSTALVQRCGMAGTTTCFAWTIPSAVAGVRARTASPSVRTSSWLPCGGRSACWFSTTEFGCQPAVIAPMVFARVLIDSTQVVAEPPRESLAPAVSGLGASDNVNLYICGCYNDKNDITCIYMVFELSSKPEILQALGTRLREIGRAH